MSDVQHDLTPDAHSSIVGGSSAARILGCPGSVDLLAKIPDSVKNASSKYADEGTGLHEVMAYLVGGDHDLSDGKVRAHVDNLFVRYNLDEERMYDAVIPALRAFNEYLDELYDEAEAAGFTDAELTILVEQRVAFPGIEGAFGTADIVIKTPVRSAVWDWKFGAGKLVKASYYVGGVGLGNEQLMFYAAATKHTHPHMFEERGDWVISLVICQPRIGDGEPNKFDVDIDGLKDYVEELTEAVSLARSGIGPKARPGPGAYDYCYFSSCKSICPLHLSGAEAAAEIGNKLLKLKLGASTQKHVTEADMEITPPGAVEPQHISYGEAMAMLLDLKAALEPLLNGVAGDAQTFMEAGGTVPGYKLVAKKAGWDIWEDEKGADQFLGRRGVSVEDRRVVKTITPAKARSALKALGDEKGVKLLAKYVRPGVSSGHTLAAEDDARPAIETTASAIGALANKIASAGK